MTAPDPGLTDLIAAHWRSLDLLKMKYNCSCGDWEYRDDDRERACASWCEHLALVVEQHTNGRIAELEAEWDQAIAHDRQPYPTAWAYEQACAALEKHRKRADKHEATIARVEKALEAAEKSVPDDWGVTYIYTSHLRAALEGEQQ